MVSYKMVLFKKLYDVYAYHILVFPLLQAEKMCGLMKQEAGFLYT